MAPPIHGKLPDRRVLSEEGSVRAVSTNVTKAGRRVLSEEGRMKATAYCILHVQ